jgi:hypothetical protein
MHENQGVCNWAVKLDGNPDPPVVVEVDSVRHEMWEPCADRFSTLIWCQIWDHAERGESLAVFAQEERLLAADLDLLRATFRRLPVTKGWPGKINYRFEDDRGSVLLWDGQDRGVDWHVGGRNRASLQEILTIIWNCGNLRNSLYGDGQAEKVLKKLRAN